MHHLSALIHVNSLLRKQVSEGFVHSRQQYDTAAAASVTTAVAEAASFNFHNTVVVVVVVVVVVAGKKVEALVALAADDDFSAISVTDTAVAVYAADAVVNFADVAVITDAVVGLLLLMMIMLFYSVVDC